MSQAPTSTPTQAEQETYAALKKAGSERAGRVFTPLADLGDTHLIEPDRIVFQETIPAGGKTARVLRYGQTMRITNVDGNSSVALYALNHNQPTERLNAPDTAKLQWNAFLGRGQLIFSDMGRVLLALTEDTCGHHDLITSCSTARTVARKFGEGAGVPNARDQLLVEMSKHGLDRRDLTAVLNLFTGIDVAGDGSLSFVANAAEPGSFVDLRAEMNTLVVLANCPHPMDPSSDPLKGPLEVTVWDGDEVGAEDFCRTATVEARRGIINTQDYLAQIGVVDRPLTGLEG